MAMHFSCAGSHRASGAIRRRGDGGACGGRPGSSSQGGRTQGARAAVGSGVPAIDIHAHDYPQGYFDVMNAGRCALQRAF